MNSVFWQASGSDFRWRWQQHRQQSSKKTFGLSEETGRKQLDEIAGNVN